MYLFRDSHMILILTSKRNTKYVNIWGKWERGNMGDGRWKAENIICDFKAHINDVLKELIRANDNGCGEYSGKSA